MAVDVRIGISGWTYKPWRGQFYPEGLPQKKELAYAASIFRSIEINGTFYSMQRCESFAQWADATPDDFAFAVKGPRYLALVCADTVEWPLLMDITSDFIDVRLHGSTELYKSAYSRPAIRRWAARIKAWRNGKPMTDGHFIHPRQPRLRPRDVFLYFDNTDKLQAPKDALTLMKPLGQA